MTKGVDPARSWAFPLFVLLAFLVSWGAIFALVGPSGLPASQEDLAILVVAMLLGPSVAGIVSIAVTSGKAGIRTLLARFLFWRVNIRWYAVALLVAPLSTALALLMLAPFTTGFFPAFSTAEERTMLIVMWLVGGVVVAFFEELGWSAFATPWLLRKRGLLATGVILGLVWGAWHFLVNWQSDSFTGLVPFGLLLARLFTWIVAYRILMVRVYEGTESVLLVVLMHFSLVATTGIIDPVLDGERLLLFLLVKAAVLWLVVFFVLRFRRGELRAATTKA